MRYDLYSGELCDVVCELALEICGFIFGDRFFRSKAVEHGADGAQLGFSFCLVGEFAQIANCVTGGLGVVTVAQTAALCLADSF